MASKSAGEIPLLPELKELYLHSWWWDREGEEPGITEKAVRKLGAFLQFHAPPVRGGAIPAGYHALKRLAVGHNLFAQVEGAYTGCIAELIELEVGDSDKACDTGSTERLWGEALEGFQDSGWGY